MLRRIINNPYFRFFASLKLAVISLLTLAAVLATATVLESLHGMRAVHVLVYGSAWFAGVLLLLGTNVFCAALSRYPWKKHQTGFVITHAGILIILFGSLLTQQFGVDGNLPVVEGQKDGEVILNDLVVTLSDENGRRLGEYPFRETAFRKQGRLMEFELAPGTTLVADDFIPRAVFERQRKKSPVPGLGLPAIHVELFNSRFRLGEWLEPRHPETPTEINLGPAVLSFRKLWTPEQEAAFLHPEKAPPASKTGKQGVIVAQVRGKEYRVDIEGAVGRWQRLGPTAFQLKVTKYFPYAIVEGNELVNKSNEPVNPAVQLLLKDSSGTEEKHTIFANFPEFATLHKSHLKSGQKPLGVRLAMVGAKGAGGGEGPGAGGRGQGQLQFAQTADNKRLLYLVRGKNGDLKGQGEVKVGEPIVTGWMDLRFQVTEWLDSAVTEDNPRYVEYISGGDSNFFSGLHVSLSDGTGAWLMEGASKPFAVGDREVFVHFGKRRLVLPFQLFLEKFTIGTDPGSSKAAAYESRVAVREDRGASDATALISMNEPLKHGGYTFYQASYQMEEGRPPVSVFSVNYDPGRLIKYFGSLVMVLGIMLMFWWNPHYVGKLVGRKPKEAVVR